MKRNLMKLIPMFALLNVILFGCSHKIKAFVPFSVTEAMEALNQTREEVNRQFGIEMEQFKEHTVLGKVVMIAEKVYTVEGNIPIDFLHLCYKVEDEDAPLSEVRYVFEYKDLKEAQRIWDWIYSQKKALDEHYGRTCDYGIIGTDVNEFGVIGAAVSEEDLIQEQTWNEQWYFDVQGSDKISHKIGYCYNISVAGSKIIVILDTNETYGTVM